jgi:hypothetical protein
MLTLSVSSRRKGDLPIVALNVESDDKSGQHVKHPDIHRGQYDAAIKADVQASGEPDTEPRRHGRQLERERRPGISGDASILEFQDLLARRIKSG